MLPAGPGSGRRIQAAWSGHSPAVSDRPDLADRRWQNSPGAWPPCCTGLLTSFDLSRYGIRMSLQFFVAPGIGKASQYVTFVICIVSRGVMYSKLICEISMALCSCLSQWSIYTSWCIVRACTIFMDLSMKPLVWCLFACRWKEYGSCGKAQQKPPLQIGGALVVIAGVCIAAFPGQEGASVFSEVKLTLLYSAAASTITWYIIQRLFKRLSIAHQRILLTQTSIDQLCLIQTFLS